MVGDLMERNVIAHSLVILTSLMKWEKGSVDVSTLRNEWKKGHFKIKLNRNIQFKWEDIFIIRERNMF